MDARPPLPDDLLPDPSAEAPSAENTARLEALLRGEELLPVPVGLLSRVRDAVKDAPPAPFERHLGADAPNLRAAPSALSSRGRSVAQRVAAAVLVAVGAALTFAGVEPVAAAGETLREAGVPTELGLSPRPVVADAVVRPFTDGWSRAWEQPPDMAALAQVPASVPGGPLTLASLSLALLGSGLGLAWRARGRRASSPSSLSHPPAPSSSSPTGGPA